MSLPEIRTKIDALDEQIIRLLNERADLVHEVGVIKKAEGSAIYAPEREEQLMRRLFEKARALNSRLPDKAIRAIYREIISASYALEYGEGVVEVHVDGLKKGARIVIVDDVLATGGTAKAAVDLAKKFSAKIKGVYFLIELKALHGRQKLKGCPVHSLVSY